jgi:hypothetical protein
MRLPRTAMTSVRVAMRSLHIAQHRPGVSASGGFRFRILHCDGA